MAILQPILQEGNVFKVFLKPPGISQAISSKNEYLGFGLIQLTPQQTYQSCYETLESALILLSGEASVEISDEVFNLGLRRSPFLDMASLVYIPRNTPYKITAYRPTQLALAQAVSEKDSSPFMIRPEEIQVLERGKQSWRRTIHELLVNQNKSPVQRLIIGETFHDPGSWSSYPPHKHDGRSTEDEPKQEEIYYYLFDPEEGFGVQVIYDDKQRDAFLVQQGDAMFIKQGYHPVVVAGGYRMYYLWIMAGNTRMMKPYFDPRHQWLDH